MEVTNFNETEESTKKDLEEQLNSFKLEKVQSLWYFVYSDAKAIAGSKGE